jgi:hypothetical protein
MMGIGALEQALREGGELRVEPLPHTPREKRKTLEQSFHVRVVVGELSDAQAAGYFGKLARELSSELSHEAKLLLVVL